MLRCQHKYSPTIREVGSRAPKLITVVAYVLKYICVQNGVELLVRAQVTDSPDSYVEIGWIATSANFIPHPACQRGVRLQCEVTFASQVGVRIGGSADSCANIQDGRTDIRPEHG